MRLCWLWPLLLLTSACGAGPLTTLRFENRDPIFAVYDRSPVPLPVETEFAGQIASVDNTFRRPVLLHMAMPTPRLAIGINSLGEVPDSSWFQNRIGRFAIDPSELERGNASATPMAEGGWTVVRGKSLGAAPGFTAEDGQGRRYIFKMDRAEFPESESAAEVVVQRLLWAAGFHVPDNFIVHFRREDLGIADGATITVEDGSKLRFTDAMLEEALAHAAKTADGRFYRAVASRYLEGIPIGGFPSTGVRTDDPNDLIPHEHRREVRAQELFFSWLGQSDVKSTNTLDTWIESEPGSGLGHVRHHLLDFGKSFGIWFGDGAHEHDGWAPHFDYGDAGLSLLALGLWRRPYEGHRGPALRGVGRYDSRHYRPEAYSPAIPYAPFYYRDRLDAYWAAKIIARFERRHIEAAVRAGRYSDPRAASYMADTIARRRDKLVRHYFAEVNPVDGFQLHPLDDGSQQHRLCAKDLLIWHRQGSHRDTRYRLEAFDWHGRPLQWQRQLAATATGGVCAAGLLPPKERAGYTMVVVHTRRGERELPPTIAHLARHPGTQRYRVIGVQRL
ncbi:MAG: hypothetical protein OEZ06_27885 [Myxococcales bacterium]|nr:hypothetical protein [Myxococcales bacterium]